MRCSTRSAGPQACPARSAWSSRPPAASKPPIGGASQTTGPGIVLGLPADYGHTFPGSIRPVAGAPDGVLLPQQTAANLHAAPGSVVHIGRPGLDDLIVTVAGVVELPQADSLFQQVGQPRTAQPQAPPDNVVVLPLDAWHEAFDQLASQRPDLVRHQVHARFDRRLPSDPAGALDAVQRSGAPSRRRARRVGRRRRQPRCRARRGAQRRVVRAGPVPVPRAARRVHRVRAWRPRWPACPQRRAGTNKRCFGHAARALRGWSASPRRKEPRWASSAPRAGSCWASSRPATSIARTPAAQRSTLPGRPPPRWPESWSRSRWWSYRRGAAPAG